MNLARRGTNATSERLVLRPLLSEDAAPLWDATRHIEFNRFLAWSAPTEQSEVERRMAQLQQAMFDGKSVALTALLAQTGDWVGTFRFSADAVPAFAQEGWLEMGLWVHPRYWAGGLAGEFHARCTELAFDEPAVAGLSARALADNIKGMRTLERQGLTREHTVDIPLEDRPMAPGWLYRISRQSWASGKAAQDHRSPALA